MTNVDGSDPTCYELNYYWTGKYGVQYTHFNCRHWCDALCMAGNGYDADACLAEARDAMARACNDSWSVEDTSECDEITNHDNYLSWVEAL